jgi:myo-inositol-1(or 4)-monophosphatase
MPAASVPFKPDRQRVTRRIDVAVEAARAAAAVIQSGHGADLGISEKDRSRTSIVTATDLRSQQEIARVIRQACPNDLIIGEEGTEGDDRADWRWYVDPLDGTTNYAHRLPFYCVSIAACAGDGVQLGLVYDPLRDEMFVARRGAGATINGDPIAVSTQRQLRSSLLSTQVQSDDARVLDRYTERLRAFLGLARAVRTLGAPALALAYVACGRLDGFFEGDVSPWDTLAGSLLVTEAGGRVTTFDGAPRPLDQKADILATNSQLHEDILGRLSTQR